jgi:hypothetical protein
MIHETTDFPKDDETKIHFAAINIAAVGEETTAAGAYRMAMSFAATISVAILMN